MEYLGHRATIPCSIMIAQSIYEPESKDGIKACLSCQYSKCVYDKGFDRGEIIRAKVVEWYKTGTSIQQLALSMNIAERTVYRYLKGYISGRLDK
tara:strand:+ start:15611 stop:15895 length:285 start_codon:yes stop_codon:yes gene_type:complete